MFLFVFFSGPFCLYLSEPLPPRRSGLGNSRTPPALYLLLLSHPPPHLIPLTPPHLRRFLFSLPVRVPPDNCCARLYPYLSSASQAGTVCQLADFNSRYRIFVCLDWNVLVVLLYPLPSPLSSSPCRPADKPSHSPGHGQFLLSLGRSGAVTFAGPPPSIPLRVAYPRLVFPPPGSDGSRHRPLSSYPASPFVDRPRTTFHFTSVQRVFSPSLL